MQYPIAPRRLAALLAVCATLAACGGGGDDTSDNDVASAAATPATADSPDTGAATGTDAPTNEVLAVTSAYTGNCSVTNFVPDTLALVNAFRAQARTCGSTTYPAAPALAWNDKLAQAAYGHSLDMATKNYFSHTSQDGRTFAQRITNAGYTWSAAGENIAAGPTTMASVMSGWQKSAGHCANLMNKSYTHIGLSCSKGSATATYRTYWTMDLAKPR